MRSEDPYTDPDNGLPGMTPEDGRDTQPGTGGSQDEPSTLDEEDPLHDATDPRGGEIFPPPPLPDEPEAESGQSRPDPANLPDGTGEETTEGAEGPNDEEERFDAG
ncbi:hypothetical protein [Zhihengliuella salsuginis]|uniref:Uncharacterized protein n=1 Tax=Zhihengliuella salsuginis TaxID=578222 RepID=A0ABQ3GLN7_9MICC|nr:hypothetical protein [Zhihengliuella salsuginis]GHD09117.1 hypothetical protein GCM10008096_21450 [Zhihengliuella salsuginis]